MYKASSIALAKTQRRKAGTWHTGGMRSVALCLLLLFSTWAMADDAAIAAGNFMVATPSDMRGRTFRATVVLILHHDPEKGTLGVILNHPTQMTVHQALPEYADATHASNPVFIGGPVEPKTFLMLVRTNEKTEGLVRVMNNVSFSANKDTITEWLARESRGNRIRVFAGYSGWAAGQLQMEINLGGWRLEPADPDTIFNKDPATLWMELNSRKPLIQTRYEADKN